MPFPISPMISRAFHSLVDEAGTKYNPPTNIFSLPTSTCTQIKSSNLLLLISLVLYCLSTIIVTPPLPVSYLFMNLVWNMYCILFPVLSFQILYYVSVRNVFLSILLHVRLPFSPQLSHL